MEIQKDHIVLGERYARVLFLKEYANFLKDDFVTELTTRCKNMMLSTDQIHAGACAGACQPDRSLEVSAA